jgi:lysophospholipid acyltransferase (LPLAT)-like uncharacterized protein
MALTRKLQSGTLAAVMLGLRATCRIKLHDDPRCELKERGQPYVYSVLHAHQVAAAIGREKGTAAMVSRSNDGELLLGGFKALGIKAIRGSSRNSKAGVVRDNGGQSALKELIAHVQAGSPAYLAVDGPRGPRNHVRKGIAVLAKETGAAVLNIVAVPNRRWIFSKAWDRLQLPKPFCHINAYFAEPLFILPGESVEDFRRRIEASLNALEAKHDPTEYPGEHQADGKVAVDKLAKTA